MTVASAYVLATVPDINYQEALQGVRGARQVANPNTGFVKQLAEFEANGLHKVRVSFTFRDERHLFRPFQRYHVSFKRS